MLPAKSPRFTARRSPPLPRARREASERGIVLLWSLVGATLVLGVVLAGSGRLKAFREATEVEFGVEGQAHQVAESGLVEALAWLRRQPAQPVTEFAPQRDLTADPIVDDTDDPAQGLVRTFPIGPSLWGQFLVRKGKFAEAFVDDNRNGYCDAEERIYDTDGNGKRTMAFGMRDVSTLRGLGNGAVWRLESEGRIFRRPREDLPLGEGPNVQIGSARLATEVRRLVVALPSTAALIQSRADEVDVKKGVLVTSPVQGIAYRASTGSPKISSGAAVKAPVIHSSTPWLTPTGGYMDDGKRRISVDEIFGVSLSTLSAMADFTSDTAHVQKGFKKHRLNYTIPPDSLVVLNPGVKKNKTVEFDKKYPLRGRGILVVNGDVNIKKGSASQFEGILVVLGKLTIHGPAKISGTVIVSKKSHIHGKKSDVLLNHDPALVNRMLVELARYRRSKATFTPSPAMLDERPNEEFLTKRRLGGLQYDANTTMTTVP